MKKIFSILIFIIWFTLLFLTYKHYSFNTDIIWKIEQQRREHLILFPKIAKVIHNKGVFFSQLVFENYLSYFSPPAFFCCNQPLILELIMLILFYGGIFILFRSNSKEAKITLSWNLLYPLFIALSLKPPSIILLLPLLIPTSGFLVYNYYKHYLS